MGITQTPFAATVRAMPADQEWLGPEPAHLRHVLFASDLSDQSRAAFDHARFLSERFRAHLTLFHLVDASRYAGSRASEQIVREADQARDYLEALAAERAVEHETVVWGAVAPAPVLAWHMRAARPDLTVMGTHGRKGLSHLLLGSVTETILRAAGRPVLCVREPAHGSALPYRRILVPADLTLNSTRAFPLATLLAHAFAAEVLVVHTGPRSPHGTAEADVYAAVSSELPAVRLAVCAPGGPAEAAILGVAGTERADLIVMSQQGHDGLREALTGNLTEHIVRESPCPVLVV